MRYIRRHRLVKKDPAAAISEPVKPIQYWVDSGAPEDVKKALIEGASWWNQAFEAAGFRNAFKVDVLPDGADPMDIRYNMINWVHRSTRGWSSGGSVTDPRTGEIIKATVTLGSLRDRQDYMIFEGLLSPYTTGTEKAVDPLRDGAGAHPPACRRTRSGHTLGLGHNYYDSTKGWISVMDYPHPLEELKADGTIDICRTPIRSGSATGTRWRSTTATASSRPAPTRRRRSRRFSTRPGTQDLRYFTNQDTDIHPRTEQWSNGVEPGGRAESADEGAPRGARPHRRAHDSHRRADDDDRRAARADLHVSPLRRRRRGVDGRRARTSSTRCAATAGRRRNGNRRTISARRSTRSPRR